MPDAILNLGMRCSKSCKNNFVASTMPHTCIILFSFVDDDEEFILCIKVACNMRNVYLIS